MPQISVIVPVYKVEPYLRRCVDSILRQTFTDFELILVDDGSPDNCGAICDEYAVQDSRVVVIHQENGGLSAARNAGVDWAFSNSDSQWISFIDSDDWVHPKYLEVLYAAALETGAPVAVSEYARTDGEPVLINEGKLTGKMVCTEDLYCERNITATIACGKLYRKEIFRDIRYPEGKIHEDEYITHRVLFQSEMVALVDAPLYAYFQNENSIMGSAWSQKRLDKYPAIRDQIAYFKHLPYQRAYRRAIQKQLASLTGDVLKLKEKPDLAATRKDLRRQLRKTLRLYRKELGLAPEKDCYYYETAYPIGMRIFWYWKAFQRKLGLQKQGE